MTLHKIDLDTGRFLCDVIVGDDPPIEASALSPAYIATPIPDGMREPRWTGTEWVEEWQGEEEPEPTEPQPTEIEKLKLRQDATENALLFLMDLTT